MKHFIYTLTILTVFLFISCSSDDSNDQPPVNNDEYITWSSLGEDYHTAQFWRGIDNDSFEVTGEELPYFNLHFLTNTIEQGDVVTINTETEEGYLGYYLGNDEDLRFKSITVEFVEVTEAYIYGEFQGSNAEVVNTEVVPNTSTPSEAVITNGKFRINL